MEWLTIEAERALYVSQGKTAILCDRLPSPVTLVVKVAGQMEGEMKCEHESATQWGTGSAASIVCDVCGEEWRSRGMELREAVIARIKAHFLPLGVDFKHADSLADDLLAIPEISEARAAKTELDALKLALLQSQCPPADA